MFHQKILDFYHSPKIRLLAVLTSWSWRPRSLGWPATPSLAASRMIQARAPVPVVLAVVLGVMLGVVLAVLAMLAVLGT